MKRVLGIRVSRQARVVPANPRCFRLKAHGDQSVNELRNLYFRERPAYLRRARKVFYNDNSFRRTFAWVVEDVVVQAIQLVRCNRKAARSFGAPGSARQFFQMLYLSLRVPMMPENYYKFELYGAPGRKRAALFLNRYETKSVLFKMMMPKGDIKKTSPLTDKRIFEVKARSAGLRCAKTSLVIDQQNLDANELPEGDVFVKPTNGKGGRAAQAWEWDHSERSYKEVGGAMAFSKEGLLSHYRQLSKNETWLVQSRLEVHPALHDISLGVAATCRVHTIIDEDGVPEPVVAAFRLPAAVGQSVDNIHAGGISSAIDIRSGVLSAATDLGINVGVGRISNHPITGAQIEGKIIPCWDEVLDLAKAAHEEFRPRVLVGWDICVTPDGPILVEGNAQPCVDHIQRTHAAPLGNHRYAELMLHHILVTGQSQSPVSPHSEA